ncbi:MAG: hypothetical protein JW956_12090 [Calditrichaceae bacterium]|nr:hypothetical protein [Calditrichaceae bacterium]
MSATFWDLFDNLLKQAESEFLNFNYDGAVAAWQNYYKITAKKEYINILQELEETWSAETFKDIPTLQRLFTLLQSYKDKFNKKEISNYTFQLYKKLLIKIYKQNFQSTAQNEVTTEAGIFEYLAGNNQAAASILSAVIESDQESMIARIYLGHTLIALKNQRDAIAILSQNLILNADRLHADDLYLSQFKMLYGKLYSSISNAEEAAWLMPFESWFRNWLIFDEDKVFYNLIRKKETNERIVQVKYYSYERYRHFARCLYIAEYARHHLKKEAGLVLEQEKYMARLDSHLFNRYRKKRKEIKPPMRKVRSV